MEKIDLVNMQRLGEAAALKVGVLALMQLANENEKLRAALQHYAEGVSQNLSSPDLPAAHAQVCQESFDRTLSMLMFALQGS